MRKPIIAGNWKMNNTIRESKALVTELLPLIKDANCDVVLCVPFTDIKSVVSLTKGSIIKVGAQNVHFAENGAYTGEISATMLKELKVNYCIIGHSERRQYFGETDETVNKKIAACLKYKIKPIVCIGETLQQRESNQTKDILKNQIIEGFKGYKSKDFEKIIIAYEPIWAIGTGKTATAQDANSTIKHIREVLKKYFGLSISQKTRIQYGGSMNAKNAFELMSMPEIDGGLIGGASLKAQDFSKVVNYDKK
ncbi:MAG: triose-phosphate isomerase [Clostridia bacterium]|nr:triose-phosphate isomerase [Clostridia bacterium]